MNDSPLISVNELCARGNRNHLRVCDCRFLLTQPDAGRAQYLASHIPGASYVDLEADLSGPVGPRTGRHPLPEAGVFRATLGHLGLTPDIPVVVYDDGGCAMAARLWWMLRWMGHSDVRVLDGGFAAWQAADFALASGNETYQSAIYEGQADDDLWVSVETVESIVGQTSGLIVDAREASRFKGWQEPLDLVAGHIPSALNRPFIENMREGTFKSTGELRQAFEALIKAQPPRDVIHSCGSGVTACHNLLAMEHAGLPGSRLFVGSWSEWITDQRREVVVEPNNS
ncbi:MAG: sulfurtransferase [Pseudomonadota bacterium]|nr:sulfurtransferase [Pseudomonadota bacterium]